METRANYLLIGLATLAGILASFAFFIWYARIEIDRQYDYYDILFDQVSGIVRGGEVRFNGLLVGRILQIGFAGQGRDRVRVTIEVDEDTPINSDTTASLRLQGVTGVSFVALTSGNPDAPPLQPPRPGAPPVIRSIVSPIDSIVEEAPQLLSEATDLLRGLTAFVTPENQARVAEILANLDTASAGLDQALTNFSEITVSVRDGVEQIAAFTTRLDPLAASIETTLEAADRTFGSATTALEDLRGTLAAGTAALESARDAFDAAVPILRERAPELVDAYAATARSATAAVDVARERLEGLADRLDAATEIAAARLREAEAPIASADRALTAVEGASSAAQRLLDGDGARLAAEARAALATVNRLLETDAPPILADVRAAAATVNRVVDEVGGDLTRAAGDLDALTASARAALDEAGGTFRTATATLEALRPAIDQAEGAVASAGSAFAAADRVLNRDLEPIATELRQAIANVDRAVAQVSADLPGISAEVRAAAESAAKAAARFEAMVNRSAPPVEQFATVGLTEFSRLAGEARALVAALDQVARRLERDPARFFLGGQIPEYRR